MANQRLEEALKEVKEAYDEMKESEFQLWDFERHVRLHSADEMIGQSNAQKMNLIFERNAQEGQNGNTWSNLNKKVKDADIRYKKAELEFEVAMNDNVA